MTHYRKIWIRCPLRISIASNLSSYTIAQLTLIWITYLISCFFQNMQFASPFICCYDAFRTFVTLCRWLIVRQIVNINRWKIVIFIIVLFSVWEMKDKENKSLSLCGQYWSVRVSAKDTNWTDSLITWSTSIFFENLWNTSYDLLYVYII